MKLEIEQGIEQGIKFNKNNLSPQAHLKPKFCDSIRKYSDNSHYNSSTNEQSINDIASHLDINSGNEKGSTDNEKSTSKKSSVHDKKGYQSEGSDSSIGSLGKKFKMFNLNSDGNFCVN